MENRFKGVDLDPNLERIIPHMAIAEEYGGVLQHLQTVWDNLSLLGQLSGTGTDMTDTRRAFNELASSLLNQLGTEALKKCLQETTSKAQVAINILVRNLFERTADIGFLSSDENIRAFLRDAAGRAEALADLRSRFREYVRKYSVYSDIILLDPHGNVCARLDDRALPLASADPLIREAIETRAGYVERFGECDLVPDQKRSLIYAFRVVDDNGALLGVLCLCFRFENEMELIFANLIDREDWTVVTILDSAGVVIASSDPYHIPVGAKLTPVLRAGYEIVRFGAMEYIATSRAAQPYQGYGGPKWYGHAMVPIQHAFNRSAAQTVQTVDPKVLAGLTHASGLFTDEIRDIPAKAERILRDLNRSVWNGSVSHGVTSKAGNATFSRILLKEISDTGAKTKDVFEGSIADLHETVVTSLLRDNQFHAALAIDIMDRNLYERANDCRWWALSPVLIDQLADAKNADQAAGAIGQLLRAINSLYTVYSNLIVFDGPGRIVACSNPGERDLGGVSLAEKWVAHILSLGDSQGYAVSEFLPSGLYDDRPTYIYGAAIRAPQQQQPVGGVAIVFDSEPQFAAMLRDSLPRDGAGNIKPGAFGLFVEPGGRVIACSDEQFRPGDMLSIDRVCLDLDPGGGYSGVTILGDTFYAVGASASSGYREYKAAQDAYRNNVVALIFTRLCDVKDQVSEEPVGSLSIRSDRMQSGAKEDIATLLVGRRWFAARVSEVVEAINGEGIVPLPFMPEGMIGCVMYQGAPLPVLDLQSWLGQSAERATAERAQRQIAVMTLPNEARFGLLVDDLGEIVEVLSSRLAPLPTMVAGQDIFADSAISPNDADDGDVVVVLRADRLYANLSSPAALAAMPDRPINAPGRLAVAKSA